MPNAQSHLIDWLGEQCGLPAGRGGVFVPTRGYANVQALAIARAAHRRHSSQPPSIYATRDVMQCLDYRLFTTLGFNAEQLRVVDADPVDGLISIGHLWQRLKEDASQGWRPMCIAAVAGAGNTGAIDPIADLVDICDNTGMHLHVDGAHGACAVLSPNQRAKLAGIEAADSISFGPRLDMDMPLEQTALLLRSGTQCSELLTLEDEHQDTLQQIEQEAEEILVRLINGSTNVVAAGIDKAVALAEFAKRRLENSDRWLLMSEPSLGVLTFSCVQVSSVEAVAAADHSAYDKLAAAVWNESRVQIRSAVVSGGGVLQLFINDTGTTAQDIETTIAVLDHTADDYFGPIEPARDAGLW